MPKAAVLVSLTPGGEPDLGSARRVLAADVAAGDLMLVKPGEQASCIAEHGCTAWQA